MARRVSSWKLSATLAGLIAMVVAGLSLGRSGLNGHGWWSLLAFLVIAFTVISALTMVLVPRGPKQRRS